MEKILGPSIVPFHSPFRLLHNDVAHEGIASFKDLAASDEPAFHFKEIPRENTLRSSQQLIIGLPHDSNKFAIAWLIEDEKAMPVAQAAANMASDVKKFECEFQPGEIKKIGGTGFETRIRADVSWPLFAKALKEARLVSDEFYPGLVNTLYALSEPINDTQPSRLRVAARAFRKLFKLEK